MFRNWLYYEIKPLVPRSVRLGVRSWLARRTRERVRESWPILPGSERRPEGWPGWPGGKKFALVLTHDVEGPRGLENVPRLIELEEKMGFRASFNFVPEGNYTVTPKLREGLSSKGFEIGIHDLRHDGKLYRSRADFVENAVRINEHLRNWGAVGFRSGFMLHNLNWLADLQVLYDSSTFDTDPFEPQPDGLGTIFPFWVPRKELTVHERNETNGSELSSESGFIELPYTLPQDSTVFLLLQERHPDIWLHKLDWIAKHGGMALLNVHPDYMNFDGSGTADLMYPAEFYERFLRFARERYKDTFWQPLARELAAYALETRPRLKRKRRVCMVTHSDYTRDARVTRYAEALADRGDEVHVLALKASPDLPRFEKAGSVTLVRIQPRFSKSETSRFSYLWPLVRFLAVTSVWIARHHAREPFDIFHIHNIPDFLVLAGLYPKLKGARVILDIHDIVPEFYASKFSKSENSFGIRMLRWMEAASSKVADHVIIANHLWLEKYKHRTGANGKCSVFINNVDTNIFFPRLRTRHDGRLIVLFPGGLQWHQGVDIAIRAFKGVSARVANAEFHIYGDGNMKEALIRLTAELALQDKVRFFNPLPVREIADVMSNADLGVVPKRADGFGNEAYSTKIMEFLSLGIPVVVSSTRVDRFYFNDTVVRFFESGNEKALEDSLVELLTDAAKRASFSHRAKEYVAKEEWGIRKRDYLDLVDRVASLRREHASSR